MSLVLIFQRHGGLGRVNLPDLATNDGESFESALCRHFPAVLRQIAAMVVDGKAQYRLVTDDQLPPQEWETAWVLTDTGVGVDLNAAKRLRVVAIVQERDRLLKACDQEFSRVTNEGPPEARAALKHYRDGLYGAAQLAERSLAEAKDLTEIAAFQATWPEKKA